MLTEPLFSVKDRIAPDLRPYFLPLRFTLHNYAINHLAISFTHSSLITLIILIVYFVLSEAFSDKAHSSHSISNCYGCFLSSILLGYLQKENLTKSLRPVDFFIFKEERLRGFL